jgi:small subunit ribosomal protein S20
MPHIKSNIKHAKSSALINSRNRAYRSMMKTAIKRVRSADAKDKALLEFQKTSSILDKMINKGIIHHKSADRYKSRLALWVNHHFSA